MELRDFIELGYRDPALRFLVIGGYAVAAHGHTRATFDVDLLARRADQPGWMTRATLAGLKLEGETSNFAQFSQSTPADGLDLMFVDDPTFEQLFLKYGTQELYDTFLRILRDP